MQYRKDPNQPLLAKEVSFLDSSLQEKLNVAKEITLAAIPNIFSSIGSQLKDVISLYFIGQLGSPLLFAAAGFGLTWANAFGIALIFGFATGFGTLASQAFGARNYYKMGLLYQKTMIVISVLLLCLGSVLWFTKAELRLLGFELDFATEVGNFIQCLTLDFFFYMLFEINRFYLTAQNIFDVPACIIFISTALHILWCHVFVNILGLNLLGMAISRTLTDGISVILILLYIRMKNPCPESWFPWTKECLHDLVPYAKEIASHGGAIYIEWIAFETTTMIIGFLGDVNVLAAHSATLNYLFVNSTISLGLTLSMNVFVGNAAGEGNIVKAKKYTYVGLIMDIIVVTFLDIFMFTFRRGIAAFYTTDPNVRALITDILLVYSFGMHADLCCNSFANLLRTLGQDKFVLKAFLGSYYGVGLTLSIIFSLIFGFGYHGVWGSVIAGCYVMLIIDLVRFFGLDWEFEVMKIRNDMRKKSLTEDSEREIELLEA